jgi:hypothetical protein
LFLAFSVEKPALKPVVVSGPDMKQRRALLLMLEKEFPDVFAFPRLTTTWPMNEDKMHKASDGEWLPRGGGRGRGAG